MDVFAVERCLIISPADAEGSKSVRKTLVSPSHEVSHLPFATTNANTKRLKTRTTRTRQGYGIGRAREGKACVSGGVAMVSCAVGPHESENEAPI